MPEALLDFEKGASVAVSCYKEGCENASKITVTLGNDHLIHPDFQRLGKIGRISWLPGYSLLRGFDLVKDHGRSGSDYPRCPRCGTEFGSAIIIFNRKSNEVIAIGYESEPA